MRARLERELAAAREDLGAASEAEQAESGEVARLNAYNQQLLGQVRGGPGRWDAEGRAAALKASMPLKLPRRRLPAAAGDAARWQDPRAGGDAGGEAGVGGPGSATCLPLGRAAAAAAAAATGIQPPHSDTTPARPPARRPARRLARQLQYTQKQLEAMTASEVETLKKLETAKVLLHGLGGAMAAQGGLLSTSRAASTSRSTQQQLASVRAAGVHEAAPPAPVPEEGEEDEESEDGEEEQLQVGRQAGLTRTRALSTCPAGRVLSSFRSPH